MIFVGQRNIGAGLFCRMRALVTDCYHLVRTLSVNNYNIVHINPSLKYYSLLRDGIFLTILRLAGMRNVVIFIHGWDEAVEKTISNNNKNANSKPGFDIHRGLSFTFQETKQHT